MYGTHAHAHERGLRGADSASLSFRRPLLSLLSSFSPSATLDAGLNLSINTSAARERVTIV